MRQLEFRQHVLALLLVSDQFCAAASSMVAPRYFDNPVEQHLCRFVFEHFREFHTAPNKMAVRDRGYKYLNTSKHLQAQLQEFDSLLDTVSDLDQSATKQIDYIQSELRSFCREQAMKDALLKSVDDIQQHKFEVVQERINKALAVGAELNGRGIYLLEDAESRKTVDQVRSIIKSGYAWLDNPLKGGLGRGETLVVMAPPNTGKTTMMIHMGVGFLKNIYKVAHFSLEMDKGVVRAKYDQCFLNKSDAELSEYDQEGHDKITKFMKRLRKNLGADIYIQRFPAHRLSMDALRSELMLLRSRDNFVPDVVIVDYLDLMAMPSHTKEKRDQIQWLGEEFRTLAIELNFAGITGSQTNRGGAQKEVATETDVAEDWSKVATCDFMFSLNQNVKETEEEKIRLFWVKNRLGIKRKTYNLLTDFERSTFITT
jgi:replicative DNA helicase